MEPKIKFPEINAALRDILGRPCFTVADVAALLRHSKKYEVERKAEDEQAVALHWMLTLYFEHGDAWAQEGERILREIAATI